jgi:hypothetical protein
METVEDVVMGTEEVGYEEVYDEKEYDEEVYDEEEYDEETYLIDKARALLSGPLEPLNHSVTQPISSYIQYQPREIIN